MRLFWLEKWRARRAGKIDGRLRMEFLQDGYPPRVRQLASDADAVMRGIAQRWEKTDKPLSGRETDLRMNVIPKASEDVGQAKTVATSAEQDFMDVMHHAGKGGTKFATLVVVAGAVAEIVVNYEPFKFISPDIPDWLNLIVAFVLSLIFMFLCKTSGSAAKEGAARVSFGYGACSLLALLLIAYVRAVAAEANFAQLVAEGEATGTALKGLPLFMVSFGIPFLLGVASFAVGYSTGPSDPQYTPRRRKMKRAQAELRRKEVILAAAQSALESVCARRAQFKNIARQRCEVQKSIFTELAMHYLEMYNRAVPAGERKALPDNCLPAEIPKELLDPEESEK